MKTFHFMANGFALTVRAESREQAILTIQQTLPRSSVDYDSFLEEVRETEYEWPPAKEEADGT